MTQEGEGAGDVGIGQAKWGDTQETTGSSIVKQVVTWFGGIFFFLFHSTDYCWVALIA